MIVYNITINVNWPVHDDWLRWLTGEHIPNILETGLFIRHQVLRLLQIDEDEGPTYAVQFYALSLELYNKYVFQYADLHAKQCREKWGVHYVDFATIMEVVV